MLNTLERLCDKGSIRQLDYQFARFIASQEQGNAEAVGFVAGLLSSELAKGHICIEPEASAMLSALGLSGEAAQQLYEQLRETNWKQVLTESNCIGDASSATPLIYDGDRLYLHRYWHYESKLAAKLLALAQPMALSAQEKNGLAALLDHLFARDYHGLYQALKKDPLLTMVQRQQLVCDALDVTEPEELEWEAIDEVGAQANRVQDLTVLDSLIPADVCLNWQKVAAAVALSRKFAVVSGGPGTGKTTTVAKLLAALVEQGKQKRQALTIRLVAPTGKAAARLTESIGNAIDKLPVESLVRQLIPTDASTIHRLLGAAPGRAEFRHHAANPLHLDILIVDEASMVDLSLMYKLVAALPEHARLILLGDKDQLASVESGAVLGDICSFSPEGYSPQQQQLLQQLTGYRNFPASGQHHLLADCLCTLQKSYRFHAGSGIGQLARAINSGEPGLVKRVWQQDFTDIEYHPLSSVNYSLMLSQLVEQYAPYIRLIHQQTASSVQQQALAALKAFSRCRLLCAVREGEFGVRGLNDRVEKSLAAKRIIQTGGELWYVGRPVMVTRNDHALGLYNGDIGLCMPDWSEAEPRLKVFFELPDGSVKAVLPGRVPEHETAYAMTIHKSQGSEFDLTMIILPPKYTPVLSRELIYTGVTRAKQKLLLFAENSVINQGIRKRTHRASGLRKKLTQ
jgi:exodeoxyribonuclease V alpha subunit